MFKAAAVRFKLAAARDGLQRSHVYIRVMAVSPTETVPVRSARLPVAALDARALVSESSGRRQSQNGQTVRMQSIEFGHLQVFPMLSGWL